MIKRLERQVEGTLYKSGYNPKNHNYGMLDTKYSFRFLGNLSQEEKKFFRWQVIKHYSSLSFSQASKIAELIAIYRGNNIKSLLNRIKNIVRK